MKITIREGVWETNSSSVHSLVYSEKGLRKSKFKPRVDGFIHVKVGYYGKDEKVYWSQKDKLSYLLTCVAYMCGCAYRSNDYTTYYHSYEFQQVEKAVLDYIKKDDPETTIQGIKVDNLEEAEMDHQTIPEYGEFPIPISIYWEPAIQNFIFNSYIGLETGCD
jgi:hypothetical protein